MKRPSHSAPSPAPQPASASPSGSVQGDCACPPIDRARHEAALCAQALQHERQRDLERRRIARQLHDELGQLLNAARMEIGQLHRQREALPLEGLDRLDELLAHATAFTRRFGRSLRPPALDLGLVPALETLCEDFRVHSGLRCTLRAPDELPLQDFIAQTLYRVAEAALSNVQRHARATDVALRLHVDARGLSLVLADDGVGLDPTQPDPALGGSLARVGLLGGDVEWGSGAAGGTRLRVWLPPEVLAPEAGLPDPGAPDASQA